jgi:hypothetical protein
MLGRMPGGQVRSVLEHRLPRRSARVARVEGRRTPIVLIDVVREVVARRSLVHVYSLSSSRSLVRA